jgi:hypothetical protein
MPMIKATNVVVVAVRASSTGERAVTTSGKVSYTPGTSTAMRKRKRLRDAEALGAVLGRDKTVGRSLEVPYGPVSRRDWELAVGSRIARRTRPKRLVRGTLYVATASAAWAQELSLLAEGILASLAPIIPDIRALRFEVGTVEPPKEPRGRLVPVPPPVKLPPSVENALGRVADGDLSRAIRDAASKNLAFGAEPKTDEGAATSGRRSARGSRSAGG